MASIGADPEWTVTGTFFEQCLLFFKDNYNIISEETLLDSLEQKSSLPSTALLLTLDDGWSDNYKYALPILRRHRVPALLFMVSGAVGRSTGFWQERLYGAWRLGCLSLDKLNEHPEVRRLYNNQAVSIGGEERLFELTRQLASLDERITGELIDSATSAYDSRGRQMLSAQELRVLAASNIRIGSHGLSHRPLRSVDNVREELHTSMCCLNEIVNQEGLSVRSVSYPHGSYDDRIVQASREVGYELLFTSDEVLNNADPTLLSEVIGRLHIAQRDLVDDAGNLDRLKLVRRLFLVKRS